MGQKRASWAEANQAYLSAVLEALRQDIAAQTGLEVEEGSGDAVTDAESRLPAASALHTLCGTFGLSHFERDVVLLCAGVELSGLFSATVAHAMGLEGRTAAPTFSLALSVLPDAEWSALAPDRPLRRWQLIEVGPGNTLTTSPLRLDERILHYLVGVHHVDQRLAGLISFEPPGAALVPSHEELAATIAATWKKSVERGEVPVIQLCGAESAGKRAIATATCERLGLRLGILPAYALPTNPAHLLDLERLWERESALAGAALYLDCEQDAGSDPVREGEVSRVVERVEGPLFIAASVPRRPGDRPVLSFEVTRPEAPERRQVWQETLGDMSAQMNGVMDTLAIQFGLSTPTIRAVCAGALGQVAARGGSRRNRERALADALWDTCRLQGRLGLEKLAQRVSSTAGWDDLVLPDGAKRVLRDVATQVRQRATVYERWGFAKRGRRGLGITAMFSGDSGTGKTMAAEVLASELRLDLFRIDLSAVVSKYIGETEKNLRRVFDAAEEGGAILLFDEADALFGKRSEVKDSHDRYANVEVSYLLQRMEAYPGLAILTTNLMDALDTAFLRRLRFIVHFPFPGIAERAEIWRRVFPEDTPTHGLVVDQLARLNVSGGHIRNIAVNAAFYAAEEGSVVGMPHLLRAARAEYDKLERPLTSAEVGEWV